MRVSFGLALLLAGNLVVAENLPGQDRTPPTDWLSGCSIDVQDGQREAWCGSYGVWEDREAQRGRRIGLNVAVIPAQSENADPDPVIFLHGGPGGAATEAIGFMAAVLGSANETRDLLFIDQRGTGSSHPLDCDAPPQDAPLQDYFNEFLEPGDVARCLEKQDADVSLYTTPIAMDDYDEVRAALGYDQINIIGASYGTRAAQIYLRRHPETVRTAVLKGVAPTNMKNPLPFAKAMERGLRGIFEACAADLECNGAYPDLEADWQKVVARFDSGPVTAEVEHEATNRRETVTITRGVFADGIRHILYSVGQSRVLPKLIHEAAQGDFSFFAQRELQQTIGFANMLSMGMFMTVTCSEDLQFVSEEEIRRETTGTFLGDYRVRRQLAACEMWEVGDVSEDYIEPVRVDNPVLLMSGEYDTATPYEGGEWVAKYMPNSLHIIVPNESHGFANPQCEIRIITDFFVRGSVDGVDTVCLEETKRPPFLTTDATS